MVLNPCLVRNCSARRSPARPSCWRGSLAVDTGGKSRSADPPWSAWKTSRCSEANVGHGGPTLRTADAGVGRYTNVRHGGLTLRTAETELGRYDPSAGETPALTIM